MCTSFLLAGMLGAALIQRGQVQEARQPRKSGDATFEGDERQGASGQGRGGHCHSDAAQRTGERYGLISLKLERQGGHDLESPAISRSAVPDLENTCNFVLETDDEKNTLSRN